MSNHYGEFQGLHMGVVAISMSRPEGVTRYLAERPLPFPLLADPNRRAYGAFGLGRTTWARMARPAILARYVRFVLRGAKVRPVREGEDALQTGGDFLVDSDRRLWWSYTSPDPTDRPAVDRLLAEARRISATGRPKPP